MALSGAFSAGYFEGNIRMGVSWSATQSIANNTSVITANMYIQNSSGADILVYGNSAPITFTINGTKYTSYMPSTNTTISNGSRATFATVTTGAIAHNADGSKSVGIKANIDTLYVQINGTTSVQNSAYVSGTAVLDTIARVTTPTLSSSNVELGSSVTISTPRLNSSFTHTLTYTFGSASGTIATGVATSKAWTPPLTLANQIPNATSGVVTITCTTYSGSTALGSKTIALTVTVPASVVPRISALTTSDPTGYLSTYGAYVQNHSTLKVATTASGIYSSTIKSYTIVANGVTYTSGATITTNELTVTGTHTITATVTDSRGRTATKTTTISVLAYTKPQITTLSAFRCLSDGTADEGGAYMKITVGGTITSLNSKNAKSFVLKYKVTTNTSYTTNNTWTAYSVGTSVIIAANVNYSYDIQLTATDTFGSVNANTIIPTAFTLLDFNSSGKGVAIGKVSEQDAFECALNAIMTGRLSVGGYNNTGYALSTSGLICSNWVRTSGNVGWYNQTHGGGWYMNNTTWLRSYNDKSIITGGNIKGGSVITSAGANLDTVNTALGTVTESNEDYFKIGNYVVMWGVALTSRYSNQLATATITFPITLASTSYATQVHPTFSVSAAGLFGDCTATIASTTTTSMEVRVFSKGSLFTESYLGSFPVNARWIVIGRWQ